MALWGWYDDDDECSDDDNDDNHREEWHCGCKKNSNDGDVYFGDRMMMMAMMDMNSIINDDKELSKTG